MMLIYVCLIYINMMLGIKHDLGMLHVVFIMHVT